MMRRALRAAAGAAGRTSPNPNVGAVVVAKNGAILATGCTQPVGQDHAEVNALRKLDFSARGATIYVTLEPCNHTGRTGPCTEALIRSGIKRAVIGMRDPHSIVDGKGIARLRAAGIEVTLGVAESECTDLLRAWTTFITQQRPYVIAKAAITLDGFLATKTGDSRWVSGQQARAIVHSLRNTCDAVVVGAGTVRADDPELTTRITGKKSRDALRVVIDGKLSVSPKSRLFQTGSSPVLVIGGAGAEGRRADALRKIGAEVVLCKTGAKSGDLQIPAAAWLEALYRKNVVSALVEGGGSLHHSLLFARRIDELHLFTAMKLLGGSDGVPLFRGVGATKMADSCKLNVVSEKRLGDSSDGDRYLIARPIWSP